MNGFAMYSNSSDATYLRSIRNTNYSMSLNYYKDIRRTDTVNVTGLNADGTAVHTGMFKKRFGLLCGDQYISSYETGGLLLMSLNLEFANYLHMEKYQKQINHTYFDIYNATSLA